MWMKQVIAAVIISVFGASIVNADLILTVDGQNPTGIPLMLSGTGPYQIEIDGNTAIEQNDIRLEAVGGTLTVISDVNHQYTFQYDNGSTAGLIWLISNTEIILDGITVPAETTIYEVFIFDNPDANLTGVCGADYGTLNPPPEEEGGEGDSIMEEPSDQSVISTEGQTSIEESQESIDYNPLSKRKIHKREKVTANCPNSIEGITYSKKESDSFAMSGEGGEQLLLDGTIEISSNITTNQIWTANNVYYISANISVQALLVIEPGTIVIFAYNTAMYVNNGGILISSGTPDNPIIYTCEYVYPDWGTYWQYLSEYGNYYFCPVYIEETASPATTVTYCFIEGALVGIVTNNISLDHPIENNYLVGNLYGIGEYGTDLTDIKNNLCYFNYTSGIDVYLTAENGTGNEYSTITISNNTCDTFQDHGITVHGAEIEEQAGSALITNNIVSGSYDAGMNLVDGYMSFVVSNNGYYDNAANKNWEFEEYYPFYETEMPYEEGVEFMPYFYLRQDCNFINAGYEYIEQTQLIGKSTDTNNIPDNGLADLGFHYPNWAYSNAGDVNSLTIDFNGDLIVNFKDFAYLAYYWLSPYNINDINKMADEWLKTGNEPNITPIISGDPNSGYVSVSVSDLPSDITQIAVFDDGKFIGNIYGAGSDYALSMNVSNSGSQDHHIKLIGIGIFGRIICSNITITSFSCSLNYFILPDRYESGKSLSFAAFNPGGGNVTVGLLADGGDSVWSQSYSGTAFFGSIPASTIGQHDLDTLTATRPQPQPSPNPRWIHRKVKNPPIDPNVEALIIMPSEDASFADFNTILRVQLAFRNKGIKYLRMGSLYACSFDIAPYAVLGNVRYLYFLGHGNFAYDSNGVGVLRTRVRLTDGTAVSVKQSDFLPGQAPSWCRELEPKFEYGFAMSWASMGFHTLEFAYFNACYSGRLKINANNQLVVGQPGQDGVLDGPVSDMSYALGMASGYGDHAYQGWYDKANVAFPNITEFQKWTRDEWYSLGELGVQNYLDDAIIYAIDHQTYFSDPNDPVNQYRLKGEGYMFNIRLRP